MTDASRYDILFDLPDGEYNKPQVGGQRTRTIRAGDTIEVESFPLVRIGAIAVEEAGKRKRQRECQENLNRENAKKKIRRLTEHNFTPEDYFGTLTWDYGLIDRFTMSEDDAGALWREYGLPECEEDAMRALNNYYRRVKTLMRQRGHDSSEFMHIYVREITHRNKGGFDHYHFHVIIHAPGVTAAELEEKWSFGFARVNRLSWADEGPARLATYLTKQHTTEELVDGKRNRRWGHSKNLIEPPVKVSDRKISRRRAMMIAADVQHDGVAIFEALYPGYKCVETPRVRYSDFVAGAYIYARLRKKPDKAPPWERGRR